MWDFAVKWDIQHKTSRISLNLFDLFNLSNLVRIPNRRTKFQVSDVLMWTISLVTLKNNNKELLRPLTLYFLCVNYTSYCLSVLLVNIDNATQFPIGAPVAQWVKCWPADLTISS